MMDQKYVITRRVLGAGAVGISETEFNTLKDALIGIRQAYIVEEKFDIVMEDYVELETDLLCQATKNVFSVAPLHDSSIIPFYSRLNRRLLHLLASSSMYIDQTKHDFSIIFGKSSEEFSNLQRAFSHEFDTVFGYRVCQLLRNLSLHQSLPIGQISYKWSRQKDDTCNHTIEFSLIVANVKCAEKLNAKTKKEIVELGQEHIPLNPLLRDYVSSLGRVHRKVRELLASAIGTWEADLKEVVKRFCTEFGNETIGLAIARIRLENGRKQGVLESHYLDYTLPSERRKQLERKNAQLNDVAAHRISSL